MIPKNNNLLIFQNQKFKLWDYKKLPDLLKVWEPYKNEKFLIEWFNYYSGRINLKLTEENQLDELNVFGLKNLENNKIDLFWVYAVEFNSADKTNVSLHLLLDIFSKNFLQDYNISGIVKQSTLPELRYYYKKGKLVFDKSNILYNEGFRFPKTNWNVVEVLDYSNVVNYLDARLSNDFSVFLVKSRDPLGEVGNQNTMFNYWVRDLTKLTWEQIAGYGKNFALSYIYTQNTEGNNYKSQIVASDNVIKPFRWFLRQSYACFKNWYVGDFNNGGPSYWTLTQNITLDYNIDNYNISADTTDSAYGLNTQSRGFRWQDNPILRVNGVEYKISTKNNFFELFSWYAPNGNTFWYDENGRYTNDIPCFLLYTRDRVAYRIENVKAFIIWMQGTCDENKVCYIDDLWDRYSDEIEDDLNLKEIGLKIFKIGNVKGNYSLTNKDDVRDVRQDYCLSRVAKIWTPYIFETNGFNELAIFSSKQLGWMNDYEVKVDYDFNLEDEYDIKLKMSYFNNELTFFGLFFSQELINYDAYNSSSKLTFYISEILSFDYSNKLSITFRERSNKFKEYVMYCDIYSYTMTKSDNFTNYMLNNGSQYMVSQVYAMNNLELNKQMQENMNSQAAFNVVWSIFQGMSNTGLSTLMGGEKFGTGGAIASGVSSGLSAVGNTINSVYSQESTRIQGEMSVLSAKNAINQLNAQRSDLSKSSVLNYTNSTTQYYQNYSALTSKINLWEDKAFILSKTYSNEVKEKINWFYKLYGWKNGNQFLLKSNVKKSPKFDYIEMDNIFITGIPKIWMDMIVNVFREGVWLINDENLENLNYVNFKENILYEE